MSKIRCCIKRIHLAILSAILAWSLVSGLMLESVVAQSNQDQIGLNNVTLWVNPEYNDPRLLLIVQGKIEGASLPVIARFLVPAIAVMNSAGSLDFIGGYSDGLPNRKSSQITDWDEIDFEIKSDTFRIEFYESIPDYGNGDKKLPFDFLQPFPINALKVIIREPQNSTGFNIKPDGTKGTDAEVYTVHNNHYNSLAIESSLPFDIFYTRTGKFPPISNVPSNSGLASPLTLDLVTGIIIPVTIVCSTIYLVTKSKKRRHAKTQRLGKKRRGI